MIRQPRNWSIKKKMYSDSFTTKVLITSAMLWEGTLCQWILWPQCTENFDSGATGPLMVCSLRMRYCGFPNRMRYYGRDRVLTKRSSSLTSRRSRDAGSGRDACAVRCQGWTRSWTSGTREEQGQSFILVSRIRCKLQQESHFETTDFQFACLWSQFM